MTGSSSHGLVNFKIRALPLPEEIVDFLQANVSILKKLRREAETRIRQRTERTHTEPEESLHLGTVDHEIDGELGQDDMDITGGGEEDVERRPTVRDDGFWGALANLFAKAGAEWKDTCERIWSFGPLKTGPNILVDRRSGGVVNSCVYFYSFIYRAMTLVPISLRDRTARSSSSRMLRDFEDSVEAGFQIATFQGPLCAEPVVGMAFEVESMEFAETDGYSGRFWTRHTSPVMLTHFSRHGIITSLRFPHTSHQRSL